MKTTFSKKDLVKFGNFLLSDKRTIEKDKDKVHNEDIESFLESIKKVD